MKQRGRGWQAGARTETGDDGSTPLALSPRFQELLWIFGGRQALDLALAPGHHSDQVSPAVDDGRAAQAANRIVDQPLGGNADGVLLEANKHAIEDDLRTLLLGVSPSNDVDRLTFDERGGANPQWSDLLRALLDREQQPVLSAGNALLRLLGISVDQFDHDNDFSWTILGEHLPALQRALEVNGVHLGGLEVGEDMLGSRRQDLVADLHQEPTSGHRVVFVLMIDLIDDRDPRPLGRRELHPASVGVRLLEECGEVGILS